MVHDRAFLLRSPIDFISIFEHNNWKRDSIYTHVKRQCYTQLFCEKVQQSQLIHLFSHNL